MNSTLQPISPPEIERLVSWMLERHGHDFHDYSSESLARRVRYALDCSGKASVQALIHAVDAGALPFEDMLHFLTVQVSEMFRDPDYFISLRENVLPILHTYPSLRLWVAGCSSGEEAYSLAILLHEEGLLARTVIYATDISAHALDRAKKGIYPLSRLQTYTRNYQLAGGQCVFSDYYTAAYDSVVLDAEIRRRITFAEHSLATDAVFAEMNLISCRNVLIYFNRTLQDRALSLFNGALCRHGFLGLGNKEKVEFTPTGRRFEPFDYVNSIYRKKLFPNHDRSGVNHGRI